VLRDQVRYLWNGSAVGVDTQVTEVRALQSFGFGGGFRGGERQVSLRFVEPRVAGLCPAAEALPAARDTAR
jgi:hypothetical protein